MSTSRHVVLGMLLRCDVCNCEGTVERAELLGGIVARLCDKCLTAYNGAGLESRAYHEHAEAHEAVLAIRARGEYNSALIEAEIAARLAFRSWVTQWLAEERARRQRQSEL